MRALHAGALTAAVPVAYLAILAALSARQLTTLDPRIRPEPDPLLTILETLGFLLALAAFAILGRRVGDPALALRAGAVAGALTGALGASAQALAAAPFLASALARYSVPESFLAVALALYVGFGTAIVAIVGAVVAWLMARQRRRILA